MRVCEFNKVMDKIIGFKNRLSNEGIIGDHQQVILKIYIQDLTSRINTNLLKVV